MADYVCEGIGPQTRPTTAPFLLEIPKEANFSDILAIPKPIEAAS
jgi:hypothetical protein